MLIARMATLFLVLMTACGGGDKNAAAGDQQRDLQMSAVASGGGPNDPPGASTQPPGQPPQGSPSATPKPAAKPKPAVPKELTLGAGATVRSAATDTITSRHHKAGQQMSATVSEDVRNQAGRVVIPRGSTITFTITELAPAENKSARDGKLSLQAISVSING